MILRDGAGVAADDGLVMECRGVDARLHRRGGVRSPRVGERCWERTAPRVVHRLRLARDLMVLVQYSGTRNNDYNAMEEFLRAALADRLRRRRARRRRPCARAAVEHGALHTELAARLPNVSASVVAERFTAAAAAARGRRRW